MSVTVHITREEENSGSSETFLLPDEAYEEVTEVVKDVYNDYKEPEPGILPEEVETTFDTLTMALEDVVEDWDEYVEKHDVDPELVDDVDCHLNEILVHYTKLCDRLGIELD